MKTLIAIAVLMLCNQVLNAEEAPGQPVAAEISASYQMMVLTNGRYLDQQGREVRRLTLNTGMTSLDVSDLATGQYLMGPVNGTKQRLSIVH